MRVKNTIILIIFFALALLMGCQGKKQYVSKIHEKGETRYKLRILPQDATKGTIIYVEHLPKGVKINQLVWLINGIPIDVHKTRLTGEWFNKSDEVQAMVEKKGKRYYSNVIKIRNTPPRIIKAEIIPKKPKKDERLEVNIETEDIDGDTVTLKYKWFVNKELVSNDGYLAVDTRRGDKIKVVVIPFDGEDYGEKVILKKTILNSAPKIRTGNKPVFDGINYSYRVQAFDPDGDTLTFSLKKSPEGMNIDTQTGLIKWKVPEDVSGSVPVQVEVDDGHGGTTLYSFEITITRK